MKKKISQEIVKSTILNKEWWYGVFGNVFATVTGITLTFGISSILEDRQQQQNARVMMLSSIRTIETDCKALEIEDSVYRQQGYACDMLLDLYEEYEGNLSQAPEDTLIKYMNNLTNWKFESKRGQTEQVFYNAAVIQQFKNVEAYGVFAGILQCNKETFDVVNALHLRTQNLIRIALNKKNVDGKPLNKIVEELIREHILSDYSFEIFIAGIGQRRKVLMSAHPLMLKLAGISEEEYRKYIELNVYADL